jgi:hypothetical protein
MQVSPTQVALMANRRVVGEAVIDFEDGSDACVFDSLAGVASATAMPLERTEDGTHPRTGQRLVMVSYAIAGGFVPVGARLEDGVPHPAAGTGFFISTRLGFPADFSDRHPPHGDVHATHELVQLRFDGRSLTVGSRTPLDGVPPTGAGVHVVGHPITAAIPDGRDLVSGLIGAPAEPTADGAACIPCSHPHAHAVFGRNYGSGFCRWQYGPRGWRLASYRPVTGADMAFEPSLVRDADGSLLMAVRGKGLKEPPGFVTEGLENTYEHFRVYRSTDAGATWASVLHLPRIRNATPVVLNRTVGGTPFLAANPWRRGVDSRGRTIPSTRWRDRLSIWPLTADRTGVEAPVCVVDMTEHFGPPRPIDGPHMIHDNTWMADHPIGSVCRLADGAWHALMAFRVSDMAINAGGAAEPACPAGTWIEEIEGDASPPIPVWRFDGAGV